jgi:hypothetical protein
MRTTRKPSSKRKAARARRRSRRPRTASWSRRLACTAAAPRAATAAGRRRRSRRPTAAARARGAAGGVKPRGCVFRGLKHTHVIVHMCTGFAAPCVLNPSRTGRGGGVKSTGCFATYAGARPDRWRREIRDQQLSDRVRARRPRAHPAAGRRVRCLCLRTRARGKFRRRAGRPAVLLLPVVLAWRHSVCGTLVPLDKFSLSAYTPIRQISLYAY